MDLQSPHQVRSNRRQADYRFTAHPRRGCSKALRVILIGITGLAIAGCGNSSNISTHEKSAGNSQAIDGYIVNAAVFCDGIRNGRTQAAGRFDCPSPTNVAQIVGGMDVGFDEEAISGGIPFAGVLKAPGGAPFLTPLSTLATNIASNAGDFDLALYDGAVESLATSLNLEDLDLEESPAENLSLAKANAKINQLIVNFSDSTDEYTVVTEQLAIALTASVPLDLNADTAAIVSTLNERLAFAAPELSVTPEQQITIAETLSTINAAIDESVSSKQVGEIVEIETGGSPYAFLIDNAAPLVRFSGAGDQSDMFYSLQEFESSSPGPLGYTVAKESEAKYVEFATNAFDVRQTITNADVDLAIEFTSTDANDERHISIIMNGAHLSMTEGISNSVQISVPDNTLLFAQAKDEFGVVTNITTQAGEDYFSTNANGNFSFAFSTLNRELSDRGYHNFTRETGNYEVTMAISGLGFGVEENNGSISEPMIYSISTSTREVTGNGLNGFFTTR